MARNLLLGFIFILFQKFDTLFSQMSKVDFFLIRIQTYWTKAVCIIPKTYLFNNIKYLVFNGMPFSYKWLWLSKSLTNSVLLLIHIYRLFHHFGVKVQVNVILPLIIKSCIENCNIGWCNIWDIYNVCIKRHYKIKGQALFMYSLVSQNKA